MKKQILKQMQKKVEQQISAMQDELGNQEVEGVASGGMVVVKMNGKQEALSVKINPEVVIKEETDVLEDLVLVALKDALEKSQQIGMQKMSQLTGGLKIPGFS